MEKFINPNNLPKEMDYYTYEEFKQFISVVDDLEWKCLFETLYFCGLRRGELKGLTWDNIDLEGKNLTINKNCVNEKETIVFENYVLQKQEQVIELFLCQIF